MMRKLTGKVALITGGNSGIGLATAQLFAQEGAQVIITGRDQTTLDEAVALIGHDVLALRGDVSSLADLDSLFAHVNSRFGGLDIVFANAGVFLMDPLQETTEAMYAHVFDINVKGVFFTVQKALPLLRDGGSVVLNASAVIHAGAVGLSLYAASKAAVRQFARNLGNELAPRAIRVNVVSPSYTKTPAMSRGGRSDEQVDRFLTVRERGGAPAPPRPARRNGQSRPVPGVRRQFLHRRGRTAGRWRLRCCGSSRCAALTQLLRWVGCPISSTSAVATAPY